MHDRFNEVGISNLGRVPSGMTFAEATASIRDHRRYEINPYVGGHRLTVCDTLRTMWRMTDGWPESPEREQMREYIAACFDYAKRMNQRMVDLKAMMEEE